MRKRFIDGVCVGILVGLVVASLAVMASCASKSQITGGSVGIQREETRTKPVTAREVRTIQHLDPDTGKVNAIEKVDRVEGGGETEHLTVSGSANGASAMVEGDKIDQGLNSTAPDLNLGEGIGGSGGDTGAKTIATAVKGGFGLIGVGILCLLGAGVALYFGLRMAAVYAGGVGILLIAIGLYPSLALFAVLAGVAGVAYIIWSEHKSKRATEALRAVAAGIEGVPDDMKAAVKAEIGKHADQADTATIATIKMKDNL